MSEKRDVTALTFSHVRKALDEIAEGEALRREKKAADPSYEPPQMGSIDSSMYLLNLKAFVGGHTAAILDALDACRKERDEVYAANAANNYDRAAEAREALEDIVAMCEPERVPLPLLNSKVIRRAREVLS